VPGGHHQNAAHGRKKNQGEKKDEHALLSGSFGLDPKVHGPSGRGPRDAEVGEQRVPPPIKTENPPDKRRVSRIQTGFVLAAGNRGLDFRKRRFDLVAEGEDKDNYG